MRSIFKDAFLRPGRFRKAERADTIIRMGVRVCGVFGWPA